MPSPDLGIYVVTAAGLVPGRGHAEVALAALAGGAHAVQIRAPELDRSALEDVVREVASAARAAGAHAIVNDDLEVALATDAGLHLGQADLAERGIAVATIRQQLGRSRLLGISADTVEQARAAEAAGADYVGVTVFTTSTKSDASPQGVDGLTRIASAVTIPVVAIGGVHAGNAARLLQAGARGLAVVSAVAGADDPVAATRALRDLVDVYRGPTTAAIRSEPT